MVCVTYANIRRPSIRTLLALASVASNAMLFRMTSAALWSHRLIIARLFICALVNRSMHLCWTDLSACHAFDGQSEARPEGVSLEGL